MGHDTNKGGQLPETAVVYDAAERRTHAEHAAEAYDYASRADALQAMAENVEPGALASVQRRGLERTARRTAARAQWHATMAVYEALVLPGYGSSVGEQLEHEREGGTR